MFLYFLVGIPGLLLSLYAQYKVKSTFKKYAKVQSGRGITGADAARRILDANGLNHVRVESVNGFLSDHYDPRSKTLRLSPDVYGAPSLSAVGVAAHEAGHALQDQQNYAPLTLRSAMVPSVQIGSWLGPIIFMAGFFMSGAIGQLGMTIAWLGVILFGCTALFALVTLPVEFDASKRAKALLVTEGILTTEEIGGVDKVLDAAALTYVAAALQAIMTLAYYVFVLTGMSRD